MLFAQLMDSQTFLRVDVNRFGKTKSYSVYPNDILVYRLKGKMTYNKDRVMAMSDSTLVFTNYTEVRLDQIKTIKMDVQTHLIAPFSFVFMAGGICFLPLNSLNNLITDTRPIYNEKATYISVALITTGFLIKQLGIRRVRLNRNTNLKVLQLDYQHLNQKDTIR